jgi:hypothetical protein
VENSKKQNTERLTAVWQNGGFSAKFNGSSSIELLCKTEHLCFDFRHFAKLQNVGCKLKKHHGTEFLIDNCYDKKFNYGIQT